jgi:hypothetical protein
VGGATSVLSRRRAAALGVVLVGLALYGASASHLPGLPSGVDVAFHATVVFPAFAAAIWLALPLARLPTIPLVGLALTAALLALALSLLGAGSLANIAKLACFALAGFSFLTLFEELWWLTIVAILVPWVDIWSVAAGPTQYVVEERPGIFERIAVAFPTPGDTASVNLGPPDVIFFSLFLAAAARFGLRVAPTWAGMTALLAATVVLVWSWDSVAGLPALPAVCLGFLLPNADLLWRDVRNARSRSATQG